MVPRAEVAPAWTRGCAPQRLARGAGQGCRSGGCKKVGVDAVADACAAVAGFGMNAGYTPDSCCFDENRRKPVAQGPTFQPVAAARSLRPKWLSCSSSSPSVKSRVSDVACKLNKPAFSSMGGFLMAPQMPRAVAKPLN